MGNPESRPAAVLNAAAMPVAYITLEELTGEMPMTDIEAALNDGGASDPADVEAALHQSVADEIHGYLAPRYSYPFPEPVQPTVKSAARVLTLFRLYKRRGLSGDANPMKDEAADMRKHLAAIGSGKILLDSGSPQPAALPASSAPKAVTGTGIVASQTKTRMPL